MTSLRLRSAVRGLVLDDADRLALVRFVFESETRSEPRTVWAPPGGGLEPGESDLEALRRELREELGLTLDHDPGEPIWTRTHVVPLDGGRWDGQTERIYLVRTPAFEIRPALSDVELAAENVHGLRWWTSAELISASGTVFVPERLPELVAQLLTRGRPAAPFDVGV